MLKQRVITASILMLAFLFILFMSPPLIFLGFVGAIFTVGAWEWSNLSGLTSAFNRTAYTLAVVLIAQLVLYVDDVLFDGMVINIVLLCACLFWAAAFFWVQRYPLGDALLRSHTVRMVMGVLVLVPAWLAVVCIRQGEHGALMVLLCLLTVAAVDVGAYFTGRRIGKRKLAPNVSPGKSWEGVWGGLVLTAITAALYVMVFGDANSPLVILVVLPAAMISVVGDLLESMVKRVRGVKDSGTILPGHGGILDRVDGLAAAVPVFAAATILTGWSL